ncbi:MAG: zinc-dependent metalloprotease, partial [Bacteroidota bacterium]
TVVERHIEAANAAFADAGIEFYLCQFPNIIRGAFSYDFESLDPLHARYGVDHTLNVYYVEAIQNAQIAAYATLPDAADKQASKIVMAGFQDEGIFIHELGHFLGLLHTHERSNGDELVNGNNCATAGDGICDTPADPDLSRHVMVGCQYRGLILDPNGEAYEPSTSNFMSYTRRSCRKDFTRTQYAIIRNFATYFYQFSDDCTVANSLPANGKSAAFPNPTHDDVRLLLENDYRSTIQINVRNVQGQLLRKNNKRKILQQQFFVVDFDDLPQGIYLLEVYYDQDKATETFKVVKL